MSWIEFSVFSNFPGSNLQTWTYRKSYSINYLFPNYNSTIILICSTIQGIGNSNRAIDHRCECGLYRVDLCFMLQLYTIIYHKLVIIIVINYISNVWCPGVNEIILKRNKIGLKFPGSNLCYSMVTKKHFTAIASDNSMLTHCGHWPGIINNA